MTDRENPQPRRKFKTRRIRIYEDQLARFAEIQKQTGIDLNKFVRAAIEYHLERCKKILE